MNSKILDKTRDQIIQIISSNHNLTAKQIHNKLIRLLSINTTYQATHKNLQLLVDEKILIKNKKFYTINPDWIQLIKKKTDVLAESINDSSLNFDLDNLNEGESVELSFNGIVNAGWFLIDKFMNHTNLERKPSIALWRFCYSVVGLEPKHLKGLKESFKKNKWHMFIEENNSADKMFGDTLKSYGLEHITFGKKCATTLSDKMIHADYIAEIIYPSTFRKLWEIQNRLPKKLAEFNLGKHFLLMRELQPKIKIFVIKDSKLANEYRKEYFHNNYKG